MNAYISVEYSLLTLISIILAGYFLITYFSTSSSILTNSNIILEQKSIEKFIDNINYLENLGSNSSLNVNLKKDIWISCGSNFLVIRSSIECNPTTYASTILNFSDCSIDVNIVNSSYFYANNTLYKIPALVTCNNIGFLVRDIENNEVVYTIVAKSKNYYEGCDNKKIILLPGNFRCTTCISNSFIIKKLTNIIYIYCK